MADARKPPSAANSFTVSAADTKVATVSVRAGETWRLRAHGRWRDAWIPCGPNGYRNFLWDVLDIRPRAPEANWFCLMGIVEGDPEGPFRIGSGCTKAFKHGGELLVFANDDPKRYDNNHGCVILTAEPEPAIPPPEAPCPPDPPGLSRTLGEATAWLAGAWRALRTGLDKMAGLLFVAALVLGVSAVLYFKQQGRDLILSAGEDSFLPLGPQSIRQVAFALGLLFMAIQGWFWPRMIIESTYGRDRRKWRPQWLLVWSPRVVAVAPFVLVALALKSNPAPNTPFVAVLLTFAASFLVYLIFRNDIEQRRRTRADAKDKTYRPVFGRGWAVFGVALAIASMIVAISWRVGPERLIGAPAVVFLGVGLIIPIVVIISQLGGDFRLPFLGVAVAVAALFSLVMDNHAVGRRAWVAAESKPASQITLQSAFASWKAQAPIGPDGARVMTLVAAEGGASRAGFWTGEVLARLQRDNPDFSHSLFAISSVSGGSVGAVGYAAALRENPTISGQALESRVRQLTGADALSPDMGALLFPDLLQRFLPISVLPDRAQAIEEAWETAWQDNCAAECRASLKAPFLDLWSDVGPGTWRPLVIVNGASEETGRRILTSKISIAGSGLDADDFYVRNGGHDVRASSAIHNGARFPWISPAGRLPDGGHILDGGYFDTVGTETVRELARKIKSDPEMNKEPIRFLIITIHYEPLKTAAPKAKPFLNEVLAPLRGIFASRDGHGAHMLQALKSDVGTSDITPIPGRSVEVTLTDREHFEEPLDWALSNQAQDWIRCSAGFTVVEKVGGNAKPMDCRTRFTKPNEDAFQALGQMIHTQTTTASSASEGPR